MPKIFSPLQDVPTTDEEAEAALRYNRDELFGFSLVGIFRCRRAKGELLLDAYEAALLASISESQEVEKDA